MATHTDDRDEITSLVWLQDGLTCARWLKKHLQIILLGWVWAISYDGVHEHGHWWGM